MKFAELLAFSGINRNVSDFLPATGELAEAENLSIPKIGVLKKSFDYEIKGSQITASQDILGGINWKQADGTDTHIVAIDGSSNAGIYVYSGGSWSDQSQSLTAAKKVRFSYSPTLDVVFAGNLSDDTRQYNGSSWSTATNLSGAPKAKFPFVFGRRVYLLNVDLSGTLYPERAYRSSLVDSGSITWDTTNDWITFDDVITGVGKNGENMFVGCEDSCYIFTKSDEKYQITDRGCVSHESIATYGEWTFWATRDGMYAFNGGSEKKISSPIQEYWDSIPEANISDIQAKVRGQNLYVYIGDITEPDTLGNVLWEYDILGNTWQRGSLADEVKHLHLYITSSGEALFMGNDDGEIFEMFTSETQNTANYKSMLETHWFDGSGVRYTDTWYELHGVGNKLSGLKVHFKVNDEDNNWKSAGELNGAIDQVKLGGVRGNRIKFLLEEYSANNMYELHQLSVGFEPGYVPEDTED